MLDFIDPTIINWLIIPLLICLARIIDVSIGTLRIIFVSRGMKIVAPLLGFVEVLIWLLALGQIMQNLTHAVNYFAYALGFAIGNYIGIVIEEKLAIGKIIVQVVTHKDASDLISFLRENDFSVTIANAEGSKGKVNWLFTIIKRSQLAFIDSHIKSFNPNAFYTVEDIRFASGGNFSAPVNRWKPTFRALSRIKRK